MSDWTQEQINTLKVFWTQGLSAGAIAKSKEFRGLFTRSAIIGKVHRLGLPRRGPTRSGVSKRALRDQRRAMAAPSPPRRITAAFKAEPPPKPRAPKKGASSMRWTDHIDGKHCAMFCEGEGGDEGFVCGAPTLPGKDWCSNCYWIVYQPAQERGRKAA